MTSFLVAAGEPSRLLALLDPDADLTESLLGTGAAVVQLLAVGATATSPRCSPVRRPRRAGCSATRRSSRPTWGPRLASAASWAGVRLEGEQEVGWSTLVTTVVEHLEVGDDDEPLRHHRGRFGR